MELAMIGLGRMGANMTERLVEGGHRVIGFDLDVVVPIMTHSLFLRTSSRDEERYAERVFSAMRHELGGHAIKSEEG